MFAIEHIHQNKLLYSVILEEHIRHLKKNDRNRKDDIIAAGVIPALFFTVMTSILYNVFGMYDMYDSFERAWKYEKPFVITDAVFGALTSLIAYSAYKSCQNISGYTKFKVERDERILNELNQL